MNDIVLVYLPSLAVMCTAVELPCHVGLVNGVVESLTYSCAQNE